METTPKTQLDLFSGIGGFSLASNWAGYRTIGFCEIDPYCKRVLRKHWPDVPVWDDVRSLTLTTVADAAVGWERSRSASREPGQFRKPTQSVDLITAGYPCQPFSLAGKRLGAEDDRHLWPEVARLLGELRPRWFLGENVAGHVNMGLDDVLSDLEALGYEAWPVVIPACAVNAPHRRDRVWIVGHANDTGLQGHGRHDQRSGERIAGPASTDADARCQQRGERSAPRGSRREVARGSGPAGRGEAEQRLGWADDGLPGRLADPRWRGNPMNAFGHDWEDGVPRVVATERNRVNRLKALGNAIVPQVAYQVLMAMQEADYLQSTAQPDAA